MKLCTPRFHFSEANGYRSLTPTRESLVVPDRTVPSRPVTVAEPPIFSEAQAAFVGESSLRGDAGDERGNEERTKGHWVRSPAEVGTSRPATSYRVSRPPQYWTMAHADACREIGNDGGTEATS